MKNDDDIRFSFVLKNDEKKQLKKITSYLNQCRLFEEWHEFKKNRTNYSDEKHDSWRARK